MRIPEGKSLGWIYTNLNELEFYCNFDIPIDSISHVKFNCELVFTTFYFFEKVTNVIYENESTLKSSNSFNNINTKLYENNFFESGSFLVGDYYYQWKLLLNSEKNIFSLGNLANHFKGFGNVKLIELTYDYLGYTYKYVGDPIDGDRDQDPEYSPPKDKWSPEDTKVLVKNILIAAAICLVSFVCIKYIVYPYLLNKNSKIYKKKK